MIQTYCSPPKEIIVYGSNNGYIWYNVSHISTLLPAETQSYFDTENITPYKIFKLQQIGANQNPNDEKRFILINIEFYGAYFNLLICSTPKLLNYIFFIYIFVLFS